MLPDETDVIAAIASAPGAAARGVIRLAGPDALAVAARALDERSAALLLALRSPRLLAGCGVRVELAGRELTVAADVFAWPDARSYTRQPSVELHLPGSRPLLDAALRALCGNGARLAQPGEFTLRAVLSGRIDLTQAEAVLGVIDARGEHDLRAALGQLAGGLAAPLGRVREELLLLLADLEAGLDFVDEEGVTFVEPAEVAARLRAALAEVAAVSRQAAERDAGGEVPTVVLAGPPNAGKSTLLNALAAIAGHDSTATPALVSERAGSTRDGVRRVLEHHGARFELVDTAGELPGATHDSVEGLAQQQRRQAVQQAAVVLDCVPADAPRRAPTAAEPSVRVIRVRTKADLAPGATGPGLPVSSTRGTGLVELLNELARQTQSSLFGGEGSGDEGCGGEGSMVPSTAARCRESLADAAAALRRAADLAPTGADELVAMELRSALDALGRVLGAVATEDVLDRIFSRFCIGK